MPIQIFNEVLSKLPDFKPDNFDIKTADYPFDENKLRTESFESGVLIPLPSDLESDPEPSNDDEEETGAAEGGVRIGGIEILAFYKSYRLIDEPPFRGNWGIYYVNEGVQHIAKMLAIEFPGATNLRKIALDFLWSHEIYHAKFDVGLLGFEAFSKQHLYLPQMYAFRHAQSHQPEEALANAAAWKYVRKIDPNTSASAQARSLGIAGISNFFFDFMKNQPGAYARFDEDHFDLRSETAAGVFNKQRSRNARANDLAPWIGLHPSGCCNRSDIPEHLVLGIKYSKLISPARYIPSVKEIRESKKFLKDLLPQHQSQWIKTKTKLLKSSCLPGLDFKFFSPQDIWSARVNDNFRAHLLPISLSQGIWEAISYGNHKSMGHG